MDMPYSYREAFNLNIEIGTCPNTEVEINVVHKILFFIKLYYVKEKDKKILDKEMKRPCHLDMFKEGFSAYSSLIMLIITKLTENKRCVSNFRCINTRIGKTSLAFPKVRDMFAMLESSKC